MVRQIRNAAVCNVLYQPGVSGSLHSMAEAQRSYISLECACDQGAAPSDLFAFTTYTPAREPSQGEAVDVILTDGARVWKSRDLNQNASGGKEAAAVRLDKLLQALTDLRPRQHDFAYQMHPTTDGVVRVCVYV